MSEIGDKKLDQNSLQDYVIETSKHFIKAFEQLRLTFDSQTAMLIDDIKQEKPKRLIQEFLKVPEVLHGILNQIQKEPLLQAFESCPKLSEIKEDPNQEKKLEIYMKNMELKCRDPTSSLTLRRQYEKMIKEARKCFILMVDHEEKDSFGKINTCRSVGKTQGRQTLLQHMLPNPILKSTQFPCRYCLKYYENLAGSTGHQRFCKERNKMGTLQKEKKIQKKEKMQQGQKTKKAPYQKSFNEATS